MQQSVTNVPSGQDTSVLVLLLLQEFWGSLGHTSESSSIPSLSASLRSCACASMLIETHSPDRDDNEINIIPIQNRVICGFDRKTDFLKIVSNATGSNFSYI